MKTTLKQSYLRIGALLLALMLTVGCLSGCGSAGAENSGGTRTVTDMADRTVELPAEINSIATFGSKPVSCLPVCALAMAMAASWSASGFGSTAQSPKISTRG